jgi:eukaryotic-like serine/threonine-protein kinase
VDRVLDGRYALGARLGDGGMARVYAARDQVLERDVAVKVLRTGLPDPRARQRFEHEARFAARFVHPHAVTIYDVGEDQQHPFFVMELIDGDDLAALLATRGPLPVPEAQRIADAMLDALGAAHRSGLVHRDVKPGNVLVALDGTVKLTDFGIAKAAADATADLTPTNQVLGTPKYLSPEQVTGASATPRSDLYAVGVVLYEMLAGGPPFTGDSPVALALAHREAPVPPLRERAPQVPAAVAAVVERALAKDPGARFAGADEMRHALADAVVDPEPAATVPLTAPLARTEILELPPEPAPDEPRGRSRVPVLAGLGAAAIAVLGLGWAIARDDGTAPTGVAGPSTTAASTPTTTVPPSTEAPPTTVAPATETPGTIGALLAQLRVDPRAFGSKGPELVATLDRIQQGEPVDTAKLADDIDQWMEKGQINPQIGALALQIVDQLPVTQDEGPGNGNGNGNGNGRGGPGEDDD